ncbi:MAG: hypothetical protein IT431_06565 [Phycisphaerales bacterium]|nr:hypothetical protein [Phycisphaerales bacterium]
MGNDPQHPTIRDGGGIERPLWGFPKTARGVPADSPLSAAEQYQIEAALGVHMLARTPMPDPVWQRVALAAISLGTVFGLHAAAPAVGYRGLMHVFAFFLIGGMFWRSVDMLRAGMLWIASVSTVVVVFEAGGDDAGLTMPLLAVAAISFAGGFAPLRFWCGLCKARAMRDIHPVAVWREMLVRDRCPSCAHPVHAVSTETRAWLACDHCSALWRAPGYGVPTTPLTPDRCPKCRYSLRGLPTGSDLTIRCPECGATVPGAPSTGRVVRDETGSVRCWGCGRGLGGLPIAYGDRVRCPDCGQWRSGLTAGDVGEAAGAGG